MSTLFLLCGLPGSGKSTRARELEQTQASLTLNTDAWMVPLFGYHMPREVFDARLATLQGLQWSLAEQLLRRGVNVTLDWGFWTHAERDGARRRGRAVGARVCLEYLELSVNELWQRLEARGRDLPSGTFELDRAALDLFAARFEPPTPDELM